MPYCEVIECYEVKARDGGRYAACFTAEGEGELKRVYLSTVPLYTIQHLDDETRQKILDLLDEEASEG